MDKTENAAIAYRIYQEYYLRSVILEQFAINKGLSTKDLTWFVADGSKEYFDLHYSITMPDIRKSLEYLIAIGYICAYEDDNGSTDITKGMLTNEGVKALQSGVLHNLANSAFFGYKSLICSYNAFRYAKIAGIGAILALVLGLISILLSLCR